MKRIVIIMLAAILILSGCGKVNQETPITITDVAASSLYRVSANKDENEFYTRPFYKAGIIFTLNVKPEYNEEVTIVPIGVNVNSFNEKIQRVEEVAAEGDKTVYNIYIENIVDKSVLEAMPLEGRRDDAPFDAACIYPAVESAAIIGLDKVDVNDLPEKEVQNIKCLIDVNKDSNPDILIIDEQKENIVSRYYIKENGAWKLLKEVLPM